MGDGSTEKRSDSSGPTKGVYAKTNPDQAFPKLLKNSCPSQKTTSLGPSRWKWPYIHHYHVSPVPKHLNRTVSGHFVCFDWGIRPLIYSRLALHLQQQATTHQVGQKIFLLCLQRTQNILQWVLESSLLANKLSSLVPGLCFTREQTITAYNRTYEVRISMTVK